MRPLVEPVRSVLEAGVTACVRSPAVVITLACAAHLIVEVMGARFKAPAQTPPHYDRAMHLGVILPNYGEGAAPEAIRRIAEAAEEAGLDSVWATEHVIVGPEA